MKDMDFTRPLPQKRQSQNLSFEIDQLAAGAVLGSTNERVERWRVYPSLQQVNHHDATKPSVSGGSACGNGAKQPWALDHLGAQPSFGQSSVVLEH